MTPLPASDPPPQPDPERLREIFFELAAIPSPSRRERAVADRVTRHLEELGLTVLEDAAAAAVDGDTGNLICLVPPLTASGNMGRDGAPAAIFGAHLDTVEPQDDIEPILEDGAIRNSRGTILGADNKAAVTALLYATELLVSGETAHGGYVLFFTVAEELGVMGSRHLDVTNFGAPLAAVFDSAGPIGGIIVRAPSQQAVRATFRGKAAHAGLEPEQGRNAIHAAAKAIARMDLGRISADTTANVGTIHGGTAPNIVPEECSVEAQCRSLNDQTLAQTAAAMIDALQAGAAEAGVDVDIDVEMEYRAFELAPQTGVVRWARSALATAGREPRLLSSGGGSDANVLNERGIPTVNLDCGMNQVHTSDEHVYLDDLVQLTEVVLELVRHAPEHGSKAR